MEYHKWLLSSHIFAVLCLIPTEVLMFNDVDVAEMYDQSNVADMHKSDPYTSADKRDPEVSPWDLSYQFARREYGRDLDSTLVNLLKRSHLGLDSGGYERPSRFEKMTPFYDYGSSGYAYYRLPSFYRMPQRISFYRSPWNRGRVRSGKY